MLSAAAKSLGKQDWQELMPWLTSQQQLKPDRLPIAQQDPSRLQTVSQSSDAKTALFDTTVLRTDPVSTGEGKSDTWVLPIVQYGAAGLRQDEACTVRLLVRANLQHLPCSGIACLANTRSSVCRPICMLNSFTPSMTWVCSACATTCKPWLQSQVPVPRLSLQFGNTSGQGFADVQPACSIICLGQSTEC